MVDEAQLEKVKLSEIQKQNASVQSKGSEKLLIGTVGKMGDTVDITFTFSFMVYEQVARLLSS